MNDVLTTRDGLIGNSPRYIGGISPAYKRFLKDDAGAAIVLTGVPTANLAIVFVNQSNPSIVTVGSGTWTIVDATNGEVSYQYGVSDLLSGGNWYLFVTCQLIGEPAPRVFDPELLTIESQPFSDSGSSPIVTIQSINLTEVNGAPISGSNAVPTSVPDGANVAQGATTDTSSANTHTGLLMAIKAFLAGTLTVSGTVTASAGTNLNTSLLALESGGHLAAIDSHTPALGQAAMVASSPVVLASNQSPVPITQPTSGTATLTSVAGSATTASILASNSSRKGVLIQNDSSSAMYLAYGATSSTSSYTVKIPANTLFELPVTPVYTGALSGIWDTATGAAKITELS